MSADTIHTILQHWTGQNELKDVAVDELELLVKEHSYSSSLQFLLAKKYAQEKNDLYSQQIQKAANYFPSALHLHKWLHQEEIPVNKEIIDDKLSSLLNEQLAQFKEHPDQEDALEFEKSLQHIQRDYFEAQGIEIDLSKLPQDKFTKQLRSFTAWLKVLKHQEENGQNLAEIGEEQEKMITAIAEKANNAAEVITEAMAEIWIKQGQKRKAIDIYSKLSFIFPEKSVYFASLIEQLKQKK
jgi:hypothetical protein